MKNDPLPRLDQDSDAYKTALKHCRLSPGEVWQDVQHGHRVGYLDAANDTDVAKLFGSEKASLFINDPPYNLVAFDMRSVEEYIDWCRLWVTNSICHMASDCNFYVWIGADQKDAFQPFPDFMLMMREFPLAARSLITMRNQRGYGTQKNWMAVRQELLYYTKGDPHFQVVYTDIPKILKGYYKTIGGESKENMERSKSENIRPGNVWVDVQQVFYRMEENVSGCYAQKPLKSADRIIQTSSRENDIVCDLFSHSGTTLIAAERLKRRCFTMDNDPVFCEITIRRLEHHRSTGKTGWQNGNAFAECTEQAVLFG